MRDERVVMFVCLHGAGMSRMAAAYFNSVAPAGRRASAAAYGFNVGCAVAKVLRERGFDARFLRGDLSAWFGAGGARMRRPEPQLAAA